MYMSLCLSSHLGENNLRQMCMFFYEPNTLLDR